MPQAKKQLGNRARPRQLGPLELLLVPLCKGPYVAFKVVSSGPPRSPGLMSMPYSTLHTLPALREAFASNNHIWPHPIDILRSQRQEKIRLRPNHGWMAYGRLQLHALTPPRLHALSRIFPRMPSAEPCVVFRSTACTCTASFLRR